jgi:leucine-rich repeat protein SHOC2
MSVVARRVCSSLAEALEAPASVRVLVIDYESAEKTVPSGHDYEELVNLERLILRGLRLGGLPPALGRLRKLKHLELFDCELARFPSFLGKLTSIESLTLQRLTVRVPTALVLPRLRRLHLAHMGLTKVPKVALGAPRLYNLDLSHNDIRTIPPELGNLMGLQFLNLMSNPLSALPTELAKLPKLRTLLLGGTSIAKSKASRQAVTLLLPKVSVSWS